MSFFIPICNLPTNVSHLVKKHAPLAMYLGLEFRNTDFLIHFILIILYIDLI